MKTCSNCKEAKPLEAYGVVKRNPDGRRHLCRVCRTAYRNTPEQKAMKKDWSKSEAGQAYHLAYSERWRQSDHGKAYKAAYIPSPESKARGAVKAQERRNTPEHKEWRQSVEGRGYLNASGAVGRARRLSEHTELSAVEREKIEKLYTHAAFLDTLTGMPHEVDHIIGYADGGTHCLSNLQILTVEEHRSKTRRSQCGTQKVCKQF